jgi:hypothetical protein
MVYADTCADLLWEENIIHSLINTVEVAQAKGCVYFLKKKYCANKRFPVTSNLRYMHGVLNVDEIKN